MLLLDVWWPIVDVLPGWIFLERNDLVRHIIDTLYPRASIFDEHLPNNFIFQASLASINSTTEGAITLQAGAMAFFKYPGILIPGPSRMYDGGTHGWTICAWSLTWIMV